MPRVSAIVVAGPQRARAERATTAALAQTAPADVEAVVVDVAEEGTPALDLPDGARLVRLPGGGWGAARTAGVQAAHGDIVAFLEDHCVPEPGWAEALQRAHERPWGAVGYAFTNANPGSYSSAAGLITDYGHWIAPAPRGPVRYLPSNNVSYRRVVLAGLEDELATVFALDFNLHEELRRRGHVLFLEPDALVAHENFENVVDLWRANHNFCRLLAANRVEAGRWSRPRRLLYGTAAPVAAPALKFARLASALRGRGHWRAFAVSLPVIVSTFAWSAVGESLGYLAGSGDSVDGVLHWEVDAQRAAD